MPDLWWAVPQAWFFAAAVGAELRWWSALVAPASGALHEPGVPADTVRGWLRAACAGSQWLYQRAAVAQGWVCLGCVDPAVPVAGRTPLAEAVDALGAAAAAIRRFFGAVLGISAWPLIVLITGGRLLRPPRYRPD